MKFKKGDWVLDESGDLGQVDKVADAVPVMVYCRWLSHTPIDGWEHQSPTWVEPQVLTKISKEVADVIFKSNEKE
jgi:hypothetical protein